MPNDTVNIFVCYSHLDERWVSADRPDGIAQEDKERMIFQLVGEFVARAGAAGVTVQELSDALLQFASDANPQDTNDQPTPNCAPPNRGTRRKP